MLLLRMEKHLNVNDYKFKDLILLVGDLNINSKEAPFRLTLSSHLKEAGSKRNVGAEKRKDLRRPLQEEEEELERFEEFKAFQKLFAKKNYDLIDHMVENDSSHPVTFGDNEYILTDHSESQSFQRLDYIFTVRPSRGSGSAKLKADSSTCVVQQFKQPDKRYGQLSDHYGISIEIK
jgi:endonuclease/exonuclease/phosphatase family metal-dependent hydrolase